MPEGIAIERKGFRTLLKWHRGHRQAGDISFTASRIAEGLAAGASVEIDLQRHAGGGFVVLHDEWLDRETTGRGPVADASPDLLRNLRLRDQAGTPTGHVPLLITDLADLLSARSATQPAPQSVPLQLDMKNSAADLTEADIAAFTRVIGPVTKSAILSCGDAGLVFRMHEAVPDLHIGYDPCHFGAVDAVLASGAFEAFVEDAVETMPFASMIYLEVRLILAARRRDFDIVGAFHRHGKTIDAYTINRSDAAILPDVLTLLDLGCDQITTDDPVGLERLVMTAAV